LLEGLKTLIDVIQEAVSGFKTFRSNKARTTAIFELLCIYYVLSDVVTEGRTLLAAVGSDPKVAIMRESEARRTITLAGWDAIIGRQASRLYGLGGRLLGQDALAILDPKLKTRLESIVGSKFERTRTLGGIGACLVMYSTFGDLGDADSRRDVILAMYPTRTRAAIDVKAADRELKDLSQALEEFRKVCTKLATDDEIFALSKTARDQTILKGAWHKAQ
jgi:hypothetical protein